jgi:hypothetical protein
MVEALGQATTPAPQPLLEAPSMAVSAAYLVFDLSVVAPHSLTRMSTPTWTWGCNGRWRSLQPEEHQAANLYRFSEVT